MGVEELKGTFRKRLEESLKKLERLGIPRNLIDLNLDQIAQIIIEALKKVNYYIIPGHEIEHCFRVAELATFIAFREGADVRKIFLASLLHDIARVIEERAGGDHAELSAKIAYEVLSNEGFERNFASSVAKIIEEHRYSRDKKPSSLESAILQDADKLDALGFIGAARIFAYGGYKGREIYDPFNMRDKGSLAHFYHKILKLADLMNTKTGRSIAEKRANKIRIFIKTMLEEINMEDLLESN
ncbi:MAG: HD domain-containing protein [Candidatus Njordarchaeales archaeon]